MIANDVQYRTTRKWVERFEEARAAVDAQSDLHPRARQALRDRRGVLPWPDRPTDERLGGEIRGRGGQRDSNQEGPGI